MEKNVQFTPETSQEAIEEVIYTKDNNEGKEITVLPTCDTLHLVRNNKSFGEASRLEIEKGLHDDCHNIMENTDIVESATGEIINADTISSLEEAVEKVVELYVTGHTPNHGKVSSNDEEVDDNKNTKHMIDGSTDNNPEIETSLEQLEELLEEATSPSQSESSRATRWEALADIAAELPPSLAVDPITGQIYALSK